MPKSNYLLLCALVLTQFDLHPISYSQQTPYAQFCMQAALDASTFKTFRRHETYRWIVETLGYQQGLAFEQEINQRYPFILPYLDKICTEDVVGDPIRYTFTSMGTCAPTTLRYIKIAGDLFQEFGDLNKFNIVEIGGGYGGQCKVLSNTGGFKSYTIIDMPQCLPLIQLFLSQFAISTDLITNNAVTQPRSYDLVISNYAFSEIDQHEQRIYIRNIIDHTPRGYMIYNHIPSMNPLTLEAFAAHLTTGKRKVKIVHEDPSRTGDIIIWHPAFD